MNNRNGRSPAHILMGRADKQHDMQHRYAEGGHAMRRGGHRKGSANVNPHTGHPQYFAWLPLVAGLAGSLLPSLLSGGGDKDRMADGGYADGGDAMRRGGRRRRSHHNMGEEAYAEGGAPTVKDVMAYTPDGQIDRVATYNKNKALPNPWPTSGSTGLPYDPSSGWSGSGLGDSSAMRAFRSSYYKKNPFNPYQANAPKPSFAKGGKANVNPHTGHPQYGLLSFLDDIPLLGPLKKLIVGAEGGPMTYAEGGYAEGGETDIPQYMTQQDPFKTQQDQDSEPSMARGGRRRRIHRAMGGVGKTRKDYPYT